LGIDAFFAQFGGGSQVVPPGIGRGAGIVLIRPVANLPVAGHFRIAKPLPYLDGIGKGFFHHALKSKVFRPEERIIPALKIFIIHSHMNEFMGQEFKIIGHILAGSEIDFFITSKRSLSGAKIIKNDFRFQPGVVEIAANGVVGQPRIGGQAINRCG